MPVVNKGFVIWFTGLSGAGKTTVAGIIESRLRTLVGPDRFVEVYADCPLDVCATRPGKVEMYERARRGELKEFTGVSDPYEPPFAPAVHLKTDHESPEESARRVLEHLREQSFVDQSFVTTLDGALRERETAR